MHSANKKKDLKQTFDNDYAVDFYCFGLIR